MIVGDATRLRQVVLNLLSNAIEYNVDGGKIMVLVASNQSEAVIEIIDRGMGISAEHLPLVQNRFFRVDQARTFDGSNGAGLGLSLVAEFVRLHGGTVDIQSQLGEGTVVRIVLPKLDANGVR